MRVFSEPALNLVFDTVYRKPRHKIRPTSRSLAFDIAHPRVGLHQVKPRADRTARHTRYVADFSYLSELPFINEFPNRGQQLEPVIDTRLGVSLADLDLNRSVRTLGLGTDMNFEFSQGSARSLFWLRLQRHRRGANTRGARAGSGNNAEGRNAHASRRPQRISPPARARF